MTKKGKKIAKRLAERQERWDNLPGTGDGNNAKIVTGIGTHFRKPGSQNLHQHN